MNPKERGSAPQEITVNVNSEGSSKKGHVQCCPIRPKARETLLWEFNRASEKLLLGASGQAQVVSGLSFLFSERLLNHISFLEFVTAGVGPFLKVK